MAFHRGRRKETAVYFIYNGVKLKYKKCYLGIPFLNTGIFEEASEYFIRRAMITAANVNKILARMKLDSLDTKQNLFQSMVEPVFPHGSEIWSLRYKSEI